ncbi:STAS domain-containing protein [Candidatus Dependentiae bacterium]|nr:STAS domain-containing protein [Candidatus Dependentiae bacterium]
MEITKTKRDDIDIIRIEGQLDGTTSIIAQKEIIPLVTPESKLVIDMGDCDYISSSGLRVLMMIGKQLSKEGGKGVLAKLSEEVRDIMEMTGFSHIFKSYPTLDEAIEALKKE